MYLVYVSAAGESEKMRLEIEGVVAKYPDLFEEPKGVVEREVVHAIEIIPGFSIRKGRLYRMSPGELDELRRQLKELVEKGWIRPSVSPYGSRLLFVPKKGGTLRMCIDYRGLDAITVKNREPLPRIDDLLDRAQGCRYFSKIDLKSGYHQIAIQPEDQHKTAFQTKWMSQPVLSDALKRWIEVIEQYNFDPQYIKGEYNRVADALSRRPDFLGALITEFELADDVTCSLVEAYREDPFMAEIIRRLEAEGKATSAEFELVNGLLFLEKAGNKRLCVPNRESLRSLFLGECHDATGHFGYKKTAANLLQQFWWPTMMRDAKLFSKYARLIAMPETAKTEYVIRLFKENWVRDFGLPKSIMSDGDVRFTSELWKAAAAEQGTQLQMTSGNHPEANGQAEQLNLRWEVVRIVVHVGPREVYMSEEEGMVGRGVGADLSATEVAATGSGSGLLDVLPQTPMKQGRQKQQQQDTGQKSGKTEARASTAAEVGSSSSASEVGSVGDKDVQSPDPRITLASRLRQTLGGGDMLDRVVNSLLSANQDDLPVLLGQMTMRMEGEKRRSKVLLESFGRSHFYVKFSGQDANSTLTGFRSAGGRMSMNTTQNRGLVHHRRCVYLST
ncbi:hypothetical protein CBR_g39864 [Chara braunii]|uniref:Integrase catalytic domain-containing protein n=1 Tax=Chara braunii TaxID=69332 RepID=A0A388LSI5_CHABU|nr:hypothetical protein CBR_g39864 [Chara braunii]|eukprot:GBG85296.1 hypothetical protein CBR_g39864 [Chara braunii]